jgi:hypothetical protein
VCQLHIHLHSQQSALATSPTSLVTTRLLVLPVQALCACHPLPPSPPLLLSTLPGSHPHSPSTKLPRFEAQLGHCHPHALATKSPRFAAQPGHSH